MPAFDDQEKVFAKAFGILQNAIAENAFPAASIAVTQSNRLIALKGFGRVTKDGGAPLLASLARKPALRLSKGGNGEVDVTTLFDLASVTKAVATTSAAAILYERGQLELEAPVTGVIPEFAEKSDPRREEVTFRMLLAHSSGLPAYEKLFLNAHTGDELVSGAFQTPLIADPGTRAEYSDIGFILLGIALERLAGESLDVFCQRELFGPLGMANTTFNPPTEMREKIPATANDLTFRKRIIQGEVQDENAYMLGGVAGHAGLFSTAEDVARFSHAMLNVGTPILRPETIALFTRRETAPAGTSRALGWDTPSAPSQSGKYFGPRSYGHLGYTGTSLWIDPDRQLSVTLLTNRTWPDCQNQAIKQVRPKFHDAVIEGLEVLPHGK